MESPMKKILLCIVFALGLACPAFGENIYVREGCSGTGNDARDGDWNTANCTDEISTAEAVAQRGDTIWVADGTYANGVTFNVGESSTTTIAVCKATVSTVDSDACPSAHGTSTGWVSTYGDGQATIVGQLNFTTDYWYFSGQTRDSSDWFDGTAYGFVVDPGGTSARVYLNGSYGKFRYTYVVGQDYPGNYARFVISYEGALTVYTEVSYCYVTKGSNHFFMRNADYCTVEYTASYDANTGGANDHGENVNLYGYYGSSDYNIIRYNIFKDSGVRNYITAVIAQVGDTGNEIYGNIFWGNDCTDGTMGWNGSDSGKRVTNTKIYNNTFVDSGGYASGIMYESSASSGNVAYNNLWVGAKIPSFQAVTQSNNTTNGSTSLFNDYGGGVFTLAIDTDVGIDVSATVTEDLRGVEYGNDGDWEIGAYAFGDEVAPAVPANAIQRVTIN